MGCKILLSGEYLIIDKPLVIKANVGSCVCVCLYNLMTKAAAMNHFLWATGPADGGGEETGKYGFSATEHIVNSLLARDKRVENYVAQIFGGAMLVTRGQQGSDRAAYKRREKNQKGNLCA